MSESTQRIPYVLIFRHPNEGPDLADGELPEQFDLWMTWIESLQAKGLSLGGLPLRDQGRVVPPRGAAPVDGPFAEGKEVIGGALTILARDLDEACAIALGCPGLKGQSVVEVRRAMDLTEEETRILS